MEEQEGVEEQREAMEKREARGSQDPGMKCVRRCHLVPGSNADHKDPLTNSESEYFLFRLDVSDLWPRQFHLNKLWKHVEQG